MNAKMHITYQIIMYSNNELNSSSAWGTSCSPFFRDALLTSKNIFSGNSQSQGYFLSIEASGMFQRDKTSNENQQM
jgi:hypothetical protein